MGKEFSEEQERKIVEDIKATAKDLIVEANLANKGIYAHKISALMLKMRPILEMKELSPSSVEISNLDKYNIELAGHLYLLRKKIVE